MAEQVIDYKYYGKRTVHYNSVDSSGTATTGEMSYILHRILPESTEPMFESSTLPTGTATEGSLKDSDQCLRNPVDAALEEAINGALKSSSAG